MKIKISWGAWSNISFKGKQTIEVDKEEWESMSGEEQDRFVLEKILNASGFDWDYSIMEEGSADVVK